MLSKWLVNLGLSRRSKIIMLLSTCAIFLPQILTANQSCESLFSKSQVQNQFVIVDTDTAPVNNPLLGKPEYAGVMELIRQRSPFGQATAVMLKNGVPYAFGNRGAIDRLSQDIEPVRNKLTQLGLLNTKPHQYGEVTIDPVVSLSGSGAVSRVPSDIDIDFNIFSSHKRFDLDELDNPRSPSIIATSSFLKDQIQQVISKGGIFSDFKAGEYDFVPDAAKDTMSRAIKWTYDEIQAGGKWIPKGSENGPRQWLTFEEAIASEGRIKVDFIIKNEATPYLNSITGLSTRHVELSLMVSLGGRRGLRPPIIKLAHQNLAPPLGATGAHVAEKDRAHVIPLRTIILFFNERHMDLARQASVATQAVGINRLNQVVLNSIQLHYAHNNFLKVIKMMATRFYYWNDFQYFLAEYPEYKAKGINVEEFKRTLDELIFSQDIEALNVMKSLGANLKKLRDLNKQDDQAEKNYIQKLSAIITQMGVGNKLPTELLEAIALNEKLLSDLMFAKISTKDVVRDYLKYILSLQYGKDFDFRQTESSFVSFKLPESYIAKYSELIESLRRKYPNIQFTHPKDLHFTIQFFGSLDQMTKDKVAVLTKQLESELKKVPFELSEGYLNLLGRGYVALIFPENQMPPKIHELILKFRLELNRLGIKPETRFDIGKTLPHISIANVSRVLGSQHHPEVTKLLMENTDSIETVNIDGTVSIFTRSTVDNAPIHEFIEEQYD